ncbi:cystatin-like [Crotalus adamanteus]|uniref:Cystatin-like n=1 Tax=Crotalus adamanteus TaxID=8729 RepID=A0AAW1AMT8_CROAD
MGRRRAPGQGRWASHRGGASGEWAWPLHSPMMHSQMPVQSLLCTLLMLPLGMPTDIIELRLSSEGVQRAVAFAVREYNEGRQDSRTYFKKQRIALTSAGERGDPGDGEALSTWAGEMGQPQGRGFWGMGVASAQMPVRSLLCALLMLPLGMPTNIVELRFSDERVQRAVAFAVREYNVGRQDSLTYFKMQRIAYAMSPVIFPNVYLVTVVLAQTTCLKRPGITLEYRKVQQCPLFPGQLQVICYFKVTSYHEDTMSLDIKICGDYVDTNVHWNP